MRVKMLRVNFFYYVALFTVVFQSSHLFTMEKKVTPRKVLFSIEEWPKEQPFFSLILEGLRGQGFDLAIYSPKKNLLEEFSDHVKKWSSGIQWTSKVPNNIASFNIVYAQYGSHGARLAKLKEDGNYKWDLVTHFRGSKEEQQCREWEQLKRQGILNLAVCKSLRGWVVDKCGFKPENVEIGDSAVDLRKLNRSDLILSRTGDCIRAASICRFVRKKMLEELLEAVAIYNKKDIKQKIFYTMVGDGQLEGDLRKKVKKLGIADYVKMPGSQTVEEICKLLSQTHIFFCPSKKDLVTGSVDGIQNAAKRAMGFVRVTQGKYYNDIPQVKRPICVTTEGEHGMLELIENRKSGLVAKPNPDSIANEVSWLIGQPYDIWKEIADNSYEAVKKFDKNVVFPKLANKFYTLIKNNKFRNLG